MRAKIAYSLRPLPLNRSHRPVLRVGLPFDQTRGGFLLRIERTAEDGLYRLTVCGPIDPSGVRRVEGDVDDPNFAAVDVSELGTMMTFAEETSAAIGFALPARIEMDPTLVEWEVLPDTKEDEGLLGGPGGIDMRWPSGDEFWGVERDHCLLSRETIERVALRGPGILLHQEAWLHTRPIAKYRELWRVLESAFRLRDQPLADRIAEYQPAIDMKFDRAELRTLLVLRHNQSHAQGQQHAQLRAYRREINEQIGRLISLVDEVILTKKNWGSDDLVVDRIASRGFVVEKRPRMRNG